MSNASASLLAGSLFALGWWIWLDTWIIDRLHHPDDPLVSTWSCLPGVLSSLGLLWINMIPYELIRRDAYIAVDEEMSRVRCMILTAFTAEFSSLLGAVYWWMSEVFLWPKFYPTIMDQYEDDWRSFEIPTGWAVLTQNILICISTFVLRFGREDIDV